MSQRKGQRHFYPVVFLTGNPLFRHELRLFFTQRHSEKIPDGGFCQIIADYVRKVCRKGVRQFLIQGEKPFLHRKSYGTGSEAFGGGIDVAPDIRLAVPFGDQPVILCDFYAQHSQRGGDLGKFFDVQ